MEYNASEVLFIKMDIMSERMSKHEEQRAMGMAYKDCDISKKTYTGLKRSYDHFASLESACYDAGVMIDINLKDNHGVIAEAVVKALLGKGNGKSTQGNTDLVTGGKRFEIKYVIKGSSSFASSFDKDTNEDILIISNLGAFIIRNKDIPAMINGGYVKKGTTRISPTILSSNLLTTTVFTERMTTEWGLNTW